MKTKQRYIYKYFSINVNTLKVLINNELYFSKPSDFNDPYDCQFNLELVPNSVAERSVYDNMNLNNDEIELFNSNFKKGIPEGLGNSFNKKLRDMILVTCFSEDVDNFLMWSHYADSHKGICLKFDWKIHEDYFQGDKVIYKSKLPTIKYSSDEKFRNEISRIVSTKLKCWSYEKEVRSVIEGKSGKRNPSFNPKALVGVIFGDKTSNENVALIKRIIDLNEDYDRIDYFRAQLIKNENGIKITAI
jgi:hypothetical protein